MSGIFSRPKMPAFPTQATPEPVERIQMVTEEAEKVRRRERRRLQTGGRPSTILSGIASALKKRLGE